MTKKTLAISLILVGAGVFILGYFRSDMLLVRHPNRPYAYISIMAFGAMLTIVGGLLWRDS